MPFLYDPKAMMYIGIAFWMFVAIVVVAALWYYQAQGKEKQKTIRLAIEKGVELDPALVEAMVKPTPARPEDYSIGGYICVPIGVGLFIFGFFMKQVTIEAFYPLLGAGILTCFVGGGLLLAASMIRRRNEKIKAGN